MVPNQRDYRNNNLGTNLNSSMLYPLEPVSQTNSNYQQMGEGIEEEVTNITIIMRTRQQVIKERHG
jgi:hypothetical protein